MPRALVVLKPALLGIDGPLLFSENINREIKVKNVFEKLFKFVSAM